MSTLVHQSRPRIYLANLIEGISRNDYQFKVLSSRLVLYDSTIEMDCPASLGADFIMFRCSGFICLHSNSNAGLGQDTGSSQIFSSLSCVLLLDDKLTIQFGGNTRRMQYNTTVRLHSDYCYMSTTGFDCLISSILCAFLVL